MEQENFKFKKAWKSVLANKKVSDKIPDSTPLKQAKESAMPEVEEPETIPDTPTTPSEPQAPPKRDPFNPPRPFTDPSPKAKKIY